MYVIAYCPVCGNEIANYVAPIVFQKRKCEHCGWEGIISNVALTSSVSEKLENIEKQSSIGRKSTTSTLADELAQHFCIPCDMCHKWFNCPDCPTEVEKCNGKKHWRMMLERIINVNEED